MMTIMTVWLYVYHPHISVDYFSIGKVGKLCLSHTETFSLLQKIMTYSNKVLLCSLSRFFFVNTNNNYKVTRTVETWLKSTPSPG